MGVQGVGDIGAGPAQPVLSLCAHPRCFFGFFLGIQKEARRRGGETPPPGTAGAILLCPLGKILLFFTKIVKVFS